MKTIIRNELNKHLALEFEAAYKYMAMSHWFDLNDLPGFATWMQTQSDDEFTHARKIINHLLERDQQVVLPPIEQPGTEWPSPVAIVEEALAAERNVTASINDLYELAGKENDRAAQIMLQWFINEQVEEENVARAILGRLRLAGDNGVGLLMVDQEMSSGGVPGAMPDPGEAN